MEPGTHASHPTPTDLRPLDLAALLDRSVDLYRSNFLLLVGCGAVLYGPFGLAGLLGALVGEVAHAVLSVLGGLVLVLAWPLVAGALVHAAASRYLGRPATVLDSYRAALSRALPLVLTTWLVGLLVTAGLFAFVVGAAVVTVATVFALHVVILEDRFYDRALVRSWELARDSWPRVIALGVLLWLLQMALGAVPPVLLVVAVRDPQALNALTSAWSALSNSVLVPLGVVPFVLLYYDVRVRQEGLDLKRRAEALGPLPPPAGRPSALPGGLACPACRWPLPGGASFCIGCGAPAAAAPRDSGPPCPACGAPFLAGGAFCVACGSRRPDGGPGL